MTGTGKSEDWALEIAREALEGIDWGTIGYFLSERLDFDTPGVEFRMMQENIYDALKRIDLTMKES